MKRVVIAVTLIAVAAIAYFVIGARHVPGTEPRHVLLITVDTLRADRLGIYGYAAARTPVLDALGRRGTRFTRAYATAPITLPSHASILTGRYPPGHSSRHNGLAMQPGAPVLAEAFKQSAFETAAFVSAFPLDRRFGLARGFDTYDDDLPRGGNGRRANERAGTATVDQAIAWVRGRPLSSRLFLWLHLFEPHAPYGTPESAPGRNASARYDDEVAAADREIGRLLDAWRDLDGTLVVAAADHGEAFGEHGEIGHSIFVYDTTLRVPLIIAGPGVPANESVDQPVTLADVAPTILGAAGLRAFDADGVDLRPVIAGQQIANRVLYAESFAPLLDFGWASLRSLRRDGLKFIAAPRPELYELATDVGEGRNVMNERPDVARDLAARVDRISGPELPAQPGQSDPEALARLRALGYTGGGGATAGTRPDPKDRIETASMLASVTSGELKGEGAEGALRKVLQHDAANPQAHQRLGFVLADRGRCAEAEPHFAAAIAGRLPSADPYLGLAMCQVQRGAAALALATLRDGLRAEPGNPIVEANIGLTALEIGRTDVAIEALRRALTIDPDLYQARFALARALARTGQRDAALREATDLLARLPPAAPQRLEVERLVAALR